MLVLLLTRPRLVVVVAAGGDGLGGAVV